MSKKILFKFHTVDKSLFGLFSTIRFKFCIYSDPFSIKLKSVYKKNINQDKNHKGKRNSPEFR